MAMGPAAGDYFRRLRETNGNTGTPPSGQVIVWGLRSTDTGRWIGNRDSQGAECLQIFRTRELAARIQGPGTTVVWMQLSDWWQKVTDAVKTGYPSTVNLLYDIENEHTIERCYSCKQLTDAQFGPQAFVEELAVSFTPDADFLAKLFGDDDDK